MGGRRTAKQQGYTLIEVLLVSAIIAALAALILSALGSAREKGRQAVCTSNLHQWGVALAMYTADYDGATPSKGVRYTHDQLGYPGHQQMQSFAESYRIWGTAAETCPSAHKILWLAGRPHTARVSYDLLFTYDNSIMPDDVFAGYVYSRGQDLPLIHCDQHNGNLDWDTQPTWQTKLELILRADQRVSAKTVPARNHDRFNW